MTPASEFHESTTISTATAYSTFQPHLVHERIRRGPETVRNDAMAA